MHKAMVVYVSVTKKRKRQAGAGENPFVETSITVKRNAKRVKRLRGIIDFY
jgi:hypothetical protein